MIVRQLVRHWTSNIRSEKNLSPQKLSQARESQGASIGPR